VEQKGGIGMIIGYVCTIPVYTYKGWQFELHSYCGPWPLKKDGNPRRCAGKKFWQTYDEFSNLSEKEQEACKVIDGGCTRIEEESE
jgi:hypothetical protein